jgi:hypothetical protein
MDMADCVPGVFGQTQFAGAALGDARRARRLIRLADQCLVRPEGTLPHKLPDPYQLDAAYRLFAEPDVTHSALLASHWARTRAAMAAAGEVVRIAHDGTEFDFSTLAIPDLGVLSGPKARGLLCHNSLAVTASGRVLGLAHQVVFRPRPAPASDTKSKSRADPHKSSRLWRDAVTAIGPAPAGARWVHVADRGADVTEFLDYLTEHGREYVVRAQHDRNITWAAADGEPRVGKLFEYVRALPAVGSRTQAVAHQGGRAARVATVAVAVGEVTVIPPRQARGRERGVRLAVTVVRVWEPAPPAGVPPLEWILLTNIPSPTPAAAWERADDYAGRWVVEELHKGQKTGVGIEALQLTTVHSLENAIAVLSVVAVALLVLRDAARQPEAAKAPAAGVVPAVWVEVLSRWRYGEAKPLTVREWVYALGRLGGHQGRPSDGPPGWQTLWRGWRQLTLLIAGYELAHPPPPKK